MSSQDYNSVHSSGRGSVQVDTDLVVRLWIVRVQHEPLQIRHQAQQVSFHRLVLGSEQVEVYSRQSSLPSSKTFSGQLKQIKRFNFLAFRRSISSTFQLQNSTSSDGQFRTSLSTEFSLIANTRSFGRLKMSGFSGFKFCSSISSHTGRSTCIGTHYLDSDCEIKLGLKRRIKEESFAEHLKELVVEKLNEYGIHLQRRQHL